MKPKVEKCYEISEELPAYDDGMKSSYSTTPSMWLSKRFLVTCLVFLGLINTSLIKLNVSIAIVEMTSKKLITEGNRTFTQQAEFNWDTSRIALILNMHEYGGMFSFLFASLPSKTGGSTTYGSLMILIGLLTLLVPNSVHLDFRLLLLARFSIGFLDNITYACRSEIFQHWIPTTERSRLMSLSFNGIFVGTTIAHMLCGVLAHKWGWPMVFYVTGACALIWALIWLALVSNYPSEDRWISKKELAYITEGTAKRSTNPVLNPYKSILMSTPFWVLCVSRIIQGWSMTTIISCLPLYVKDATHKSTDFVGYISSIPSAVCTLMIPLAGTVMDRWKNNSKIKITKMHKIIIGSNFFGAAGLLAVSMLLSNFILTITCFAIIRTLLSCNALVLLLAIIYMAPNHAGTVSALSTFWYALGNIASQFAIGEMTTNHSIPEWNGVFTLTTTFMTLGAVLFILRGSSEPQSWSKAPTSPYCTKKVRSETTAE